MVEYYLDTSAIVRLLIGEEPKASEIASYMNNSEYILHIPDLIVAEVVYVLESNYCTAKNQIADKIEELLLVPNARSNKDTLSDVVSLYKSSNFSFADSYLIVMPKRSCIDVLSYDEKLVKHLKRNGSRNRKRKYKG